MAVTIFRPATRIHTFTQSYGAQWIKNFTFDQNNKPVSVRNFLDAGGGIVFVAADPVNACLYYISWSTEVRKISYAPGVNQPPTAVASADLTYGPGR
jgi:hypothetical protein